MELKFKSGDKVKCTSGQSLEKGIIYVVKESYCDADGERLVIDIGYGITVTVSANNVQPN